MRVVNFVVKQTILDFISNMNTSKVAILRGENVELRFANEILNAFTNELLRANGVFIDKCTATGKYFWMVWFDENFSAEGTGFDTIKEAYEDVLDYLAKH